MSKSSITTEKKIPPVHPGKILKRELKEMGVSLNELARALRVPPGRMIAIANGQRAITADTALRLGRYFGMSAAFWLNLQQRYDLDCAEDELAARIEREVLPRNAA